MNTTASALEAQLTWQVGDFATLLTIKEQGITPLPLFSPLVKDFLSAWSELLSTCQPSLPDLCALGFFLRRRAIEHMQLAYEGLAKRALGVGVVFHSSPSNVPTNFAYSFVMGLLAGNCNLVRLPKKPFPQVDMICAQLNKLLSHETFAALKPYCLFFSCASTPEALGPLSAMSKARVIFGGDDNIRKLHSYPLPPAGRDLAFADRYSLAVLNAATYNATAESDQVRLAQSFFQDTYLNDQNACSSPAAVVWVGTKEDCTQAATVFWQKLHKHLHTQPYALQTRPALSKLEQVMVAAAENEAGTLEVAAGSDEVVTRVQLHTAKFSLKRYKGNSGLFYELAVQSLEEITPLISADCQSLLYYGFSGGELREMVVSKRLVGIDRIVPIGQALRFTPVWDGIDMIAALSRQVAVL